MSKSLFKQQRKITWKYGTETYKNPSEKIEFDQAKGKEIGCWVETSAIDSIEPILRDRIHPSRIMSSRWKMEPSTPKGRKATARSVVRGFEDPDAATVCTESPTLSRDWEC